MANTINYAEKWNADLIETLIQGSVASPFVTTAVNFLDAKTFHFTSMQVSGFKNHSRAGGWNAGEITQQDHAYVLDHDRDVSFLIDKADVDESAGTANIQNIATSFTAQQAVPEVDALFFEKVAKAASDASLTSSTATTAYTPAAVYGKLKDILKQGKLRRYRANGSLMMYVSSDIMDALERSTDFDRKIEMTQVAEGGLGIETRVTAIDGVPVLEVIDDERFYSEFNWAPTDGGFEAKTGAYKLNVVCASLETVKIVPKIQSIYWFEPGAHTEGDGYLYQQRDLSGCFVFPNGKDGNIDSVFVDMDTTAVA